MSDPNEVCHKCKYWLRLPDANFGVFHGKCDKVFLNADYGFSKRSTTLIGCKGQNGLVTHGQFGCALFEEDSK